MNWIPCKERTPNSEYEEVLACDLSGNMLVGFLYEDPDSETGFGAESDNCLLVDAIAWMPLPEPYKEET